MHSDILSRLMFHFSSLLESAPNEYKFDHRFPSLGYDVPLVILYGELGTMEFATVHSALSEMAVRKQIQYVFRHYYKVSKIIMELLQGYVTRWFGY